MYKVGILTIIDIPEIVYHDTTTDNRQSLLTGVDITKSAKRVDFGKGFYTTQSEDSALELAIKRATAKNIIAASRTYPVGIIYPVVFTYIINVDKMKTLKHRIFEEADDEWKDFVFDGRMAVPHLYDFTYGPVADAKIMNMVSDYENGKLDKEGFKNLLKSLKSDYYQLVVHTESAKECLNFEREVQVNGYKFVARNQNSSRIYGKRI